VKNNQIFYYFLNSVSPTQKDRFKKTKIGYETYTPINRCGEKVSFNTQANTISHTKLDTQYIGGGYESVPVENVYKVVELEDRLRFIPT